GRLSYMADGDQASGIGVPRSAPPKYNPLLFQSLQGGRNGNADCRNSAPSRRALLAALAEPPRGPGVVLACYLYLASLLVPLVLEDRLLFPGATVARAGREPPDYLHVRELILDSAAGDHIHAWFTAPEGWQPSRGAVLHSHGNGSNLSPMS